MGKTPRERLTERLAALGYKVDFFITAEGFWRKEDCARWEAYAWNHNAAEDAPRHERYIHILSYGTMTACARRGLSVTKESDSLDWWAYPGPSTRKKQEK